jgi:hypothetical protein
MAQAYKYRPAKRNNSRVTVGLYSASGGGKTYSALLLGRGLVGPDGKLGLADTEGGRGELFADVAEIGGYAYTSIEPPFTPASFIQAIDDAEKAGLDCLIIDSMSHEWEGQGGVLDMASANEERTKKAGLHNWKAPKAEHTKLILKITRSRIHLIVCLRAKRKTRQGTKDGKTVVAKDDFYTPKMDEDFIFELLAHAEILNDHAHVKHSLRVSKSTHPEVAQFFKDGIVITKRTGELLRQWSIGKLKLTDADRKTPDPPQKPAAQVAGAGQSDRDPPEWDDDSVWAPEEGWPDYSKISDWGAWSRDKFLPKATRAQAEGWSVHWRTFWNRLIEMADQDKAPLAIEMKSKLQKLLNEAMKRTAAK